MTTKLVLNLVTTLFLLGYTQEIHALVRVANQPALGADELQVLREPLNVVHAAVALLLLLIASVLAMYKPRGLTRHGYRRATRAAARPVVDAGAFRTALETHQQGRHAVSALAAPAVDAFLAHVQARLEEAMNTAV